MFVFSRFGIFSPTPEASIEDFLSKQRRIFDP
jgi:hypothetical protein